MEELLKDPNVLTLLTTLVILSVTSLKIIEFLVRILIKRLTPKDTPVLSDDEFILLKKTHSWIKDIHHENEEVREWIKELWEAHDRTDGDGIPLWYVPRSLVEMQKEVIQILQSISQHQAKINFVLESLVSKMNEFRNK